MTVRATSKMTRKGQVTVPIEVREALGLKEGDRVEFELVEKGKPHAVIQPAGSAIERTAGIFKDSSRPGLWKIERAVAREEMAQNAAREGMA